MLHRNLIETENGFRALTEAELNVVGGGTLPEPVIDNDGITVFGSGGSDWVSITPDQLAQVGIFMFGSADYDLQADTLDAPPDDGGFGLLDRLPSFIELDERQQAFALVLEALGVPAALAAATAIITSYLSSYEFKAAMGKFFTEMGITITTATFGPPEQSTGDPLEDLRRAYGPMTTPEFPE